MRAGEIIALVRSRYMDPRYAFRDRLYFLFGTAGLISAGAAFVAAVGSGLPMVAAVASMVSFFVMLILMSVSFFMKNIAVNRMFCSIFLNFFMFPVLFWVTGGVNCGMMFYFILGLSVAALILSGKSRIIVLTLALLFDMVNLHLGFRHPELAYSLSYEERWMDIISSFAIVAVFIVTVIVIMSKEYQREHDKVTEHAEQLNRQAITDNLTKLYNQRFLAETIGKIIGSYREESGAVSIVMYDLDDFKKINDTYGHLQGNQVLRRFASILQEKAGERYMAARYGGEEFVMLLPGCSLEAAVQFAEMIRLDVMHDRVLSELTGHKFSVSGGVAQYKKGETAEEWVNRADANLYRAKRNGKNRIAG